MSTRWRLDLAYDGRDFSGWAIQPGLRSVQGVLEQWLQQILRLPEPVHLTVAGRTDAGVHARGQVAHVDLPSDLSASSIMRHVPEDFDLGAVIVHRLARALPADVVVSRVSRAPQGFDARFSAIWRRYVYRLTDGPPDPLTRGYVAQVKDRFDVELFNQQASTLLGLRDFAPFCKSREGATTIRDLRVCEAVRRADGVVETTVLADAFCHSMVRSLMGALSAVATGRRSPEWLAEASTQSSRVGEIHVAAACGLVLEEVGYPADDQLAARAIESRAMRDAEELSVGLAHDAEATEE